MARLHNPLPGLYESLNPVGRFQSSLSEAALSAALNLRPKKKMDMHEILEASRL